MSTTSLLSDSGLEEEDDDDEFVDEGEMICVGEPPPLVLVSGLGVGVKGTFASESDIVK